MNLARLGCRRPRSNTRVIDPNHAAHAAHKTNAHQHRGTRDTGFSIRVVDREIGQRMQPEKRHTGVEEPVQTIGGQ